ncbi:MAG: aspartate/glutamate racemase family protein [Spirochaetia bacterium]|jgi:Asp/Glu/hydantoin racemase|nr:aspartate/glutamate racemase family protein [Spirochaetia bacterium]
MKNIGLIYTVRPVLDSFVPQLSKLVKGQVAYHNLFDDFLASDPGLRGFFSKDNKLRLFNDIRNMELAGSELIVVTCSTLTPTVEEIRPFIQVPVIAIDDAMCELAVKSGSRIRVIATARSTVEPTERHLRATAIQCGFSLPEITSSDDSVAYEAMKRGDMELHDKRVLQMIADTSGYDVIVLAQASMAHLADQGSKLSGIPVLGSVPSCQAAIATMLNKEGD